MRVAVVGSGLLGVTSAYFLAESGCEVTVLDRAAAPAQGASYANSGMLTPSMADPWNAPGIFRQVLRWIGKEDAPFLLRPRALPSLLFWGVGFLCNARPERFHANMAKNLRLASYSLQQLRALRDRLGLQYDQRMRGTLKVFRHAAAFEDAARRNEVLARLGLDVRALDPEQCVQREPALASVRERLVGGIYCPEDESGDARAFTEALTEKARILGVQFRYGIGVRGFEREGGRVSALLTAAGAVQADAYVLAAGSWSPLLLRGLGLSPRLPVQPVKGYSITVSMNGWAAPPQMPVIDDALHAAATPLGNRLRVAGTAELAGYDLSLTPARVENLFSLLLRLYPSFEPHLDRNRAAPWAGLRPMSPDGVPRIGRLGLENLYVNTGHGHLGWTLACGSSRLLADLVQNRKPEIDSAPYDAQR